MNNTLSPTTSPKMRRRASTKRARAGSFLPPVQTPEAHEQALAAIRTFLRARISYDAFPVSFRIIVLDTKLEVKKALQCLLSNGAPFGAVCRIARRAEARQAWCPRRCGTATRAGLRGC
jgi:5'-AMP-activated protein kinase regulatory gamma subunit